ncbi:MAG: CotH kinase family protein, partial [Chitinophagales bacterium]|nr:CotH kinase family protein [Chitinophagales bacterium]
NPMTVQANYDYVNERLNFGNMIDYMIINTYVVNCDWVNWNTEWWRGRNPAGGRTKWAFTFWDEDNILGLSQNYSGWPTTSANAGPCDLNSQFSNAGPDMGSLDMLGWLMENADFKNLYINRYADLMNTTLSCDTMMALYDEFVNILTPEMPAQIARWGGSMTGWETNHAKLATFINDRCIKIDSLLNDCYDVVGPYDITVSVSPPLAGTVKVSSINIANYPWTGTYFGNVDLNFKGTVTPGNNMQFDHWEVNNNVVNPNINSDSMTINLQADDNVVAVFKNVLPEFALTINVVPTNTGTVTIETTTPGTYPYSSAYLSGDEINLSAHPDGDYVFDYWELNNHFVNPNSTTPDVYFTLYTFDVITAHFKPYTGITSPNITSLQVYPTLTQDKFNIAYELTDNADLNINVYSLAGQLIKDLTDIDPSLKQQGKHESTVSMKEDDLAPGIYFLQFDQPGYIRTFKIVMLPH